MPRIYFVLVLASACTPAAVPHARLTEPEALVAPVAPDALTPARPRTRRVARLAPPFAASPSTRRIEDASPHAPLELAAMP